MYRRIKAGTTDVSVVVRIIDSTDGTPETGVVFNTSGIDLWYRRETEASTDITEATLAALTTAHTDGGFLHINDGYYRLDLPDAACASGVAGVQIGGVVTGMVVIGPYIEFETNTASDVYTRLGAPAGASTAADIAAVKVDTAAILVDTGTTLDGRIPAALVGGRMDCNVGAISSDATAADNAEAFFDGTGYAGTGNTIPTVTTLTNAPSDPAGVTTLLSRVGTPTDFGSGTSTLAANLQDMADNGTAVFDRSTDSLQALRDHIADGTNLTEAGGTGDHLTAINLPNQTMDIVGNITGNLSGSVGSVSGAVGSVTGAVGSVTGNVGGNVTGSVGSLAAQARADVNAEVVDALNTDTYAEPGQGAPAATTTLVAKIGYLYKAWRNRSTQTASEYALYADDATTKDQEAVVSDNGTTLDRGEVGTGA